MFILRKSPGDFADASYQEQRDLDRLFANPTVSFNMFAGLKINGIPNVTALECAVGQLGAKFDALRTCFEKREGHYIRCVMSELPLVPLNVLTAQDVAERRQAFRAEVDRRFEPGECPAFSVTLAICEDGSSELLCVVSHVVSDKVSIDILMKELSAAYCRALSGEEPSTPKFSLSDFVSSQHAWLGSAEGRAKRELFSSKLKEFEDSGFDFWPSGFPARFAAHDALMLVCKVPPQLKEGIDRFILDTKGSAFSAYSSIAALACAAVFRKPKFIAPLMFSNRHYLGAEDVIGHLASPLPAFFDFAEESSFEQAVGAFQRYWTYCTNHFGSLPYRLMNSDLLGYEPGPLMASPFSRAFFNFIPASKAVMRDFGGLPCERLTVEASDFVGSLGAGVFFSETASGDIILLVRGIAAERALTEQLRDTILKALEFAGTRWQDPLSLFFGAVQVDWERFAAVFDALPATVDA